ncbi:MAG: pentapeptide repeat-containing protein [Methanothrix sp.]|nr:pentapeptide repeat-containing protein [Methanothrix sp.]
MTLSIANGACVLREVNASDVLDNIKESQRAEFDDCIILGDLNINVQNIGNLVHFNNTYFQNSVSFSSTIFNKEVYFENTTFNGPANFKNTTFNGPANFKNTTFNGPANFWDSKFNLKATFWDSKFNRAADFSYSKFNRIAIFDKSKFNDIVEITCSEFDYTATFKDAAFNGITINIWNTTFNGDVGFKNATFNGDVGFEGSTFNKKATFEDAIFNKVIDFSNAIFSGSTSFRRSRFKDDAIFENAIFKDGLDLTRTKYEKFYISWSSIKPDKFLYTATTYLLLIKNFKNLGLFDDANDCYYQYRKAHLSQVWWPYQIFEYPALYLYGYGVKPLFPIYWAVFLIGFFWLIYSALDLGMTSMDSLKFSIIVLLSGAGPFLSISSNLKKAGKYKNLALAEKILGSILFALFLIALSKTITGEIA